MEIKPEFGYVVAAIGTMFVPLTYGAVKVIQARKKFGVHYPDLYAKESHKNKKEFDCVQRAHQNTLENYAPVVAMAIVNGLTFPITTAASLVAWSVGRMLYIRGYSSGHPEKRSLGGAISHLADLPLFVMCFVSAHKMLK